MPNNYLTIGLCSRDWERLDAEGKDCGSVPFDKLDDANLCELLAPLPERLRGIVSCSEPYRCVHKKTGQVYTDDCNDPKNRNDYHRVVLTDDEQRELRRYCGAVTWYEWQNKEWGTKWGTYDTKARVIDTDGSPVVIEFQSAWVPPNRLMMEKITKYLCDRYYLKDIAWVGHDPSDNSVVVLEKEREP
jgi:hypothetical protein